MKLVTTVVLLGLLLCTRSARCGGVPDPLLVRARIKAGAKEASEGRSFEAPPLG